MLAIEKLNTALDAAEKCIEIGETVDSEGLESCCQDLVTWVQEQEKMCQSNGKTALEASEMEQLRQLFERMKVISQFLEQAQGSIHEKLSEMHKGRRAIGGYAFLKPESTHRQFLNQKA